MAWKSEAENEAGHEESAGRARNNEMRVRSRSRTLALSLSRSLAPSLPRSLSRSCLCVNIRARVCPCERTYVSARNEDGNGKGGREGV
jgi:hypothetical protein